MTGESGDKGNDSAGAACTVRDKKRQSSDTKKATASETRSAEKFFWFILPSLINRVRGTAVSLSLGILEQDPEPPATDKSKEWQHYEERSPLSLLEERIEAKQGKTNQYNRNYPA